MTEKSGLFWGLVIGLVGNLLVSTAFALVEHPEWAPYLNPMYIFSWIAFVAFCTVLLFRKDKYKRIESEKTGTVKKPDKEKPTPKSLIAEYRVLNEAIWRRGRDSLVVNSIMIPASLVFVTFGIEFRNQLERNVLTGLPNAVFIPLVSLILVVIPYLLWFTSTILDKICLERIHEIEDVLHIKGNQWVLEQTKCNIWLKLRRHMWHFFFVSLIVAYLFTAFWLFRETIIV